MPKRRASIPDEGPPTDNVTNESNGGSGHGIKKRRGQPTSQRTGQACDRCRTRKMKCDASLGGCRPCLVNRTPCTTTDRITGNPTTRGELEAAKLHIRDLESQLQSFGVDIKAFSNGNLPGTESLLAWQHAQQNPDGQIWANDGELRNTDSSTAAQNASATAAFIASHDPVADTLHLPNLTSGIAGDKYLGVSTENSFLSSSRGPKLNMLGWEINIADFTSSDFNEPDDAHLQTGSSHNKSFQSFVSTMFGVSPRIMKVDLPPREVAFAYADGYLRVMNPFLPILHKPTFLSLLARFYDESNFDPSAAECVLVHMVFATMIFQMAKRNWEDTANKADLDGKANLHFHYCIGLLPQLVSGHKLQDVQALTMISAHVRTFPKPEISWIIVNMTFNKAIELGLHKSAKRWITTNPSGDELLLEMRKRTFWSLLVIHVTISGKQGRPMPIRVEDFDIEIPEAYDDDLLTEAGLDSSKQGKCSFLIGLEAFKVGPLFIELYNEVYAARRPHQQYIKSVRRLESKLRHWREQWNIELREESTSDLPNERVYTQYLNMWVLEFRLLLRHPSLSLTTSAEFNNENLEICMDVCHKMLECIKALQSFKSLDTTWYSCAVYVLAIQTTLYGHGRLKDELTPEQLSSLKLDMDAWLSIMGDIGRLLGSGGRLQNTIREQVERSLDQLEDHLAPKTASYALSTPNHDLSRGAVMSQDNPTAQPQDNFSHANNYSSYSDQNHSVNGANRSVNYLDPGLSDQGPHPYPPAGHYTYPEPSAANLATYPTIASSYNSTQPYPAQLAAQALMQQASVHQTNHIYANAQPASLPYAATNPYGADSQSWQQYTQGISFNIAPQGLPSNEEYQPANALLQLGGRGDQGVKRATAAGDISGGLEVGGGGGGQSWPTMLFDNGQGGV